MIRIHTLGGFAVLGSDGNPLTGAAAQPRRMAILALLARAGSRGMSREKMLALLWPDADDERGPRALAQALYALRKDLGAEDAISGAKELRFDPALVSSDVGEFASALARGEDERAIALYEGPFLDGFHLPSAEAFSRWVEQERRALEQEQARVLESLARTARARGDIAGAVSWWRRLAASEPLNARVTVGLMDALATSGDRAGALKHVRIYQLLVQQELDLPPDRDVMALAERIRQGEEFSAVAAADPPSTVATAAEIAPVEVSAYRPPGAATSTAEPVEIDGAIVGAPTALPVSPSRQRRRARMVGATATALLGIAVLVVATRVRGSTRASSAPNDLAPTVAVGRIAAFGNDSAQRSLAAPLADLLATGLARVRGIRVVSPGRMLELMRLAGTLGDTSSGGFVNAARGAGATEIIDGTLYARPGGRLRLDLRRVDVASGAISDARTVEGDDLFALVDSGTARLVETMGSAAPHGSVSDVTTRSLAAFRMYEQGIHAYYRGDARAALVFFDGALAEDSLFALAAYYGALSDPAVKSYRERMERARRLAMRATDRERLTILAGWAFTVSSPSLGQFAETLATRYPAEIQGHLFSGIAKVYDGAFLAGVEPLETVVKMDSLEHRDSGMTCASCDALRWLVSAYELVDSLPAAEREARRWLRLQPSSSSAALTVVEVLDLEGRSAEADSLMRGLASRDLSYIDAMYIQSGRLIRIGDYAAAERLLRTQLQQSDDRSQQNAYWNLALGWREQGRYTAALDAARRVRVPAAKLAGLPANKPPLNILEAQIQLEMQRPAMAAVMFDSLSRQHYPGDVPSQLARATVWVLAQAAGARRAAGDTATLGSLADSIQALGAESAFGRDRRLHHYVRGILLASRGDDANAIEELQSAIYSPSMGYTRANYELARIYLRERRPRDAVAVLQPALRGAIESSNLYLNRTEIHELLGQAWDAAGVRDSAVAHYKWVAKAWAGADPVLNSRAQAVRARLATLTR